MFLWISAFQLFQGEDSSLSSLLLCFGLSLLPKFDAYFIFAICDKQSCMISQVFSNLLHCFIFWVFPRTSLRWKTPPLTRVPTSCQSQQETEQEEEISNKVRIYSIRLLPHVLLALLQHLANVALSHICHGLKSKFHHFSKVSEAVSRFKSIGKQMDPKCLN